MAIAFGPAALRMSAGYRYRISVKRSRLRPEAAECYCGSRKSKGARGGANGNSNDF